MRHVAVSVALVLLAAGPADAAGSTTSFEGRCLFAGTVSSREGFAAAPGATTWTVEANGVCSGYLDGQPVAGIAARFEETVHDPVASCAPVSLGVAEGTLSFGGAARIGFTRRHLLSPAFELHGAAGGRAVGYETAFTTGSPSAGSECTGDGIRSSGVEIRLETLDTIAG